MSRGDVMCCFFGSKPVTSCAPLLYESDGRKTSAESVRCALGGRALSLSPLHESLPLGRCSVAWQAC